MQFATLAQTLMQKVTRIAGDAAKVVTIRYADGPSSYDPTTGSSSGSHTDVILNYSLIGDFTIAERIRWSLNETVEKIVLAATDCVRIPAIDDYAICGSISWRITKVMRDMAGSAIVLAVVTA